MLMIVEENVARFLPDRLSNLDNPQMDIPHIAKDRVLLQQIESAIQQIPTAHDLYQADSRKLSFIPNESVHLVVTSPPIPDAEKVPGP